MKIMHIADLHLGKKLHEFSLLEDQKYILNELLVRIREEVPDVLLIVGDIYDKPVPPTQAVQLFDDFLYALSQLQLTTLIIAGNHDSPERLAFGNRLFARNKIHVSSVYQKTIEKIELRDEWGKLNFYLLPFIKPAHVRPFYPEQKMESYTEMMEIVLTEIRENFCRDTESRNILLCHQFVTGALRSDSEEINVGGLDNIDARVFDGFDYVALGHIHIPQNIGSERIRYCGTLLKYSFSEEKQDKSISILEIGEKTDRGAEISLHTISVMPLRNVVSIRGSYDELTAREFYSGLNTEDYIRAILTDEEDVPEAMGKLRSIYKNLLRVEYDHARTSTGLSLSMDESRKNTSPLEIFTEFYRQQNSQEPEEEQLQVVRELLEQGGNYATD